MRPSTKRFHHPVLALLQGFQRGQKVTENDFLERPHILLMTVCAVLASLIPILWESGIGSDVMKPIAAPIVGGMVTSTIHVLILVPVFFVMMKERVLKRGTLLARSRVGSIPAWSGRTNT
jgi:Cu/Ag efflux pump CusA